MSEKPVGPQSASTNTPPTPSHVELKASLLLALLVALVIGAALYLSYARGAFERTQRLILVSPDAEGVSVGMNMTFAGFPIGRVRKIELASDGNARIIIDVPVKDAHWLRTTSIFTLVHGVVGSTNIRAYSGVLTDPPLPDGAERPVLSGDASAEIPRLMSEAKQLLQNLNAMTAEGSSINESLANIKTFSDKLNGKSGAVGALLGGDKEAARLQTTLERANALLARVDGVAAKMDLQVFGSDGLMRDARGSAQQLNALLAEARGSLKRIDAVLEEAKAVGANAKTATADLGTLRAEVEATLRHVDHLINEINRKWPFAKDVEVKLP